VTPRSKRLALGLALAALLAQAGALAFWMPAAAALPDASPHEAWRDRVAETRNELELARQRLDAAETAVNRMRHSQHPRGSARVALFAERDEARVDLAEAERSLEELIEQARRAGVPPGWLRAPAADSPAAPE
jgi:septal ring factor EnvC (AmiA/AmiB activator)